MFTQDGDSKYVANILSNMANGGDRSVQVTTVSFSFIFALLISFPLKLGGRGCLFLTFTSDDVPCHKLPPHPDIDTNGFLCSFVGVYVLTAGGTC